MWNLKFRMRAKIYCFITSLLVIILPFNVSSAQEREGEETYSISLIQTAESDKEIHEIDDKKVLTESYTIQRGDHLWKILRKKGLLKKRNLPELISMLKKLNRSLVNLDLIHPGESIIIPLAISPIKGLPELAQKAPEITIPIEELKDADLENYTVKSGDSLIKIIKGRHNMPKEDIHDEYLQMVKKLNPSIKDLNTLYPGQTIRLPIYSPQVVRMPIKPTPPPEPELEPVAEKRGLPPLSNQLREIFNQIGEEWVQTGEHFIPLKPTGQINLKADSFPIINLSNGNRLIVDFHHDLPDNMVKLIESSWESYRIVPIGKDDDLRGALEKIFPLCDYHKIYKLGEPLVLGGDIPLRITADWIIQLAPGVSYENSKIIMLTITDDFTPKIPPVMRDFLGNLGIKAIDYPPADEPMDESIKRVEILEIENDISDLVEMLLNLTGQSFSSRVEIPVYQSEKSGFDLIIKADFLLNLDGKDCIIDLTGLGPDVLSLLREHRFLVLPLSSEKNPSFILSKTLDFLGVTFDSELHTFLATDREETRNVSITIPGTIFEDNYGQTIFATHLRLPDEITNFLSQRGYKIFSLALSADPLPVGAGSIL